MSRRPHPTAIGLEEAIAAWIHSTPVEADWTRQRAKSVVGSPSAAVGGDRDADPLHSLISHAFLSVCTTTGASLTSEAWTEVLASICGAAKLGRLIRGMLEVLPEEQLLPPVVALVIHPGMIVWANDIAASSELPPEQTWARIGRGLAFAHAALSGAAAEAMDNARLAIGGEAVQQLAQEYASRTEQPVAPEDVAVHVHHVATSAFDTATVMTHGPLAALATAVAFNLHPQMFSAIEKLFEAQAELLMLRLEGESIRSAPGQQLLNERAGALYRLSHYMPQQRPVVQALFAAQTHHLQAAGSMTENDYLQETAYLQQVHAAVYTSSIEAVLVHALENEEQDDLQGSESSTLQIASMSM